MREENFSEESNLLDAEENRAILQLSAHSNNTEEPSIEMNEVNQRFEDFKMELAALPDVESKLKLATSFMEEALAQGKAPDFKSFWEVRRLCLDLFKEPMPSPVRSDLWTKYHELSKEARRLKDILDEESNFASEQIEMAIQTLESEIDAVTETLENLPGIDFPKNCQILEENYDFYNAHQKELNLLNVYASRINAMRKELIKTEMRIRTKNKFFQRLSKAGDLVFPRRKTLIQEVSEQFSKDVDKFIELHFNRFNEKESIFGLREDIKALQGAAKLFTLNAQSFNHTRLRLSESWDKLKSFDKERKKEIAHKKEIYKTNAQAIHQSIADLLQKFSQGELIIADAHKAMDSIIAKMRETSLGREDVKELRDELAKVRDAVQEKVQAAHEERQRAEAERDKQKRQMLESFTGKIQQLISGQDEETVESLQSKRDALLNEINSAAFSKTEKQELEKALRPVKDIVAEKKERALMALPEDERLALEQLKELLKQRKERRQKVKEQLESLRKAKGSSGLDFEKAMQFNEEINQEKERLEAANKAVKEVEDKIKEMES